jgi:hypothetical protein
MRKKIKFRFIFAFYFALNLKCRYKAFLCRLGIKMLYSELELLADAPSLKVIQFGTIDPRRGYIGDAV